MTPIPTIIVAGFLGAGKTTLLRRLLTDPQGLRYGVLLNDFGSLDIDGAVLAQAGADRIALDNGCICCAVPDSLTDAIDTLLATGPEPAGVPGQPPIDRLVIETSGISRPLPVADALAADPGRIRLDGIYCLIDAAGFADLDFAATELALDQATGADLVVLNKSDLAGPARLDATLATLRAAMPRIRTVATERAALPPDLLFAFPSSAPAHHHHHAHDDGAPWQTWSYESDRPLDPAKLRRALKSLPDGVLRTKGRTPGLTFQTVGKRTDITTDPSNNSGTAAIAIGPANAFDPAALTTLFDACA